MIKTLDGKNMLKSFILITIFSILHLLYFEGGGAFTLVGDLYVSIIVCIFLSYNIFFKKTNFKFKRILIVLIPLYIVTFNFVEMIFLYLYYLSLLFAAVFVLAKILEVVFNKININRSLLTMLSVLMFFVAMSAIVCTHREIIIHDKYSSQISNEEFSKRCSMFLWPSRKSGCYNQLASNLKEIEVEDEKRNKFKLKYKDLLQDPINAFANENLSFGVNYDPYGQFTLCKGIPKVFGDFTLYYATIRNHEPNTMPSESIHASDTVYTDESIELRYMANIEDRQKLIYNGLDNTITIYLDRSSPNNKANPYYIDQKTSDSNLDLFKKTEEFNRIAVRSQHLENKEIGEEIGKTILDICRNQPVIIVNEENEYDPSSKKWIPTRKLIY